MDKTIVLTLGHNSSAILIVDGQIMAGYEEERFTQKKSDSAFPVNALQELNMRYDTKGANVLVSHWYPNGILPAAGKHWNPDKLDGFKVINKDFILDDYTHHDAHRDSALVFAEPDFPTDCHIIVVDGFGTLSEHTSVYHRTSSGIKTLDRYWGYKYSPGLFYQYATKFCGMTMHAHEYKMLAYETRILSVIDPTTLHRINDYIDKFSDKVWNYLRMESDKTNILDSLVWAEEFTNKTLTTFIDKFYGYPSASESYVTKVFTSYFAQRHIENLILRLRRTYNIKNLVVVGGVFYNVKLNHLLCESIPGKFCAMPLAGDQGAGIGLYQHTYGHVKWPNHLFWGHRAFDYDLLTEIPNLIVTQPEDLLGALKSELRQGGRVNLVRGSMEFGPRALCHTSTLAIPSLSNTIMINTMNSRTTEMPFGLVMSKLQADEMLEDVDKIHKSLEYMIMARKVKPEFGDQLRWGSHYYPLTNDYTCRPQITQDPVILELVTEFGPLINTSWNYHGVPIVFGTESIIYTHVKEQARTPKTIKTIIERR